MKINNIAISLALLALAGCCTWNGPAVATTGAGIKLCAKHRIPLKTVSGFCIHLDPHTFVDPDIDELERVNRCYPNAIPWDEWLESGRGGDPATITYCPECERGAQRIRR